MDLVYRITNFFHEYRLQVLVKRGMKLGKNVNIGANYRIEPRYCWLLSIGDNCLISDDVTILTHDASLKRHIGFTRFSEVTIGKNSFIGAKVTILPGVHIGEGSIIGAGSVVTRDVPERSVVVGNPGRVISTTDAYIEKHRKKLELQLSLCSTKEEIARCREGYSTV